MTNSSTSFSESKPSGESGQELVAFADCEIISINSAITMVINRQNGNQQIIAREVVEGLKSCTNFKTVEAHAAHLASTRADLQGQESMAAAALNNLKKADMLLKASTVCDRLNQSLQRELPATRAFIITCDRPAAVERLLNSMLRVGKLSQHNALFLVDDSREPVNQEANREAVAQFNLTSAKDIFYVGAEAQDALLSGLIGDLPQHEEGLRFLLDPDRWQGSATYGRSRTICLLLSVGFRALVMDDDILCQAVLPATTRTGVGIGSGALRQAGFFSSEKALFQSGKVADFDPLSEHASLLGSNLGLALHDLNAGPLKEEQLLDCNAALANALSASSPVLVTQSGALGDPGTGSAHWVLGQDETSLARLLAAPQGMQAAIEARLNWLGSERPNIYKMPFMSQLTGLDNSRILPPYFPAYRGEDGLFGAFLVLVQPQGVALEYPWSVPHLPMDTRAYSVRDPIATGGGMALVTRYVTDEFDYSDAPQPEQMLELLSQGILRVAARSDDDLRLIFRRELVKWQAGYLQFLQEQLARSEKFRSAELKTYFSRGITELQQAISQKGSPIGLKGLAPEISEEQIYGQFRTLARGFGAALSGWTAMREAAAEKTEELISSKVMLPS